MTVESLLSYNPSSDAARFRNLEDATNIRVQPPYMLRLDCQGCGKRLRGRFETPRDRRFHSTLVDAAIDVMRFFSAPVGFVGSDEVSFLACGNLYNGRIEKIVSISSGMLSSKVSLAVGFPVVFDSRIIRLEPDHDLVEVTTTYVLYRARVVLGNLILLLYKTRFGKIPNNTKITEVYETVRPDFERYEDIAGTVIVLEQYEKRATDPTGRTVTVVRTQYKTYNVLNVVENIKEIVKGSIRIRKTCSRFLD